VFDFETKEDEMGGVFGTYTEDKRSVCTCSVLAEKLEGTDNLEFHGGAKKNNIQIDLTEIRREGVGWAHVSQVRDKWRALVNIKIRVS
jgi:hypothetical protein